MEPKVGQLISNKYRLVRLIGDGGMGSVFEARHELLGTTVALKFLHGALARRKGLVERFLQEAQVSARIKSQHVVTVSDVDRTPEGLAYMVMEYVEGETLQTLYEKLYQAGERLSYADAFRYMLQMCEGVRAAHKLDIVHRDLKPDNVMLTPNGEGGTQVMILDFGIAKLKASGEVDRGLTRPGVVMGTPEYMAPEQAFSADKVDKRADIFSLGVMFFEMLAGRRPVGGDNAHAIAAQYLEGTIAQLRDLKPSIDPALAAAVHKAMSAKPASRFDSVSELRNAILPFAPDASVAGIATPTPAPVSPQRDSPPVLSPAPVSPVPKTVPPEKSFSGSEDETSSAVITSAPDLGSTEKLADAVDAAAEQAAQARTGDGEESDSEAAGDSSVPASADDEEASDGTPAAADADEEEPELHSGETTKQARAEANALRGATEHAGPEGTAAMLGVKPEDVAAGQDPLRAGTEPMPEGAVEAMREAAAAGGSTTQAGDPGFIPPAHFDSGPHPQTRPQPSPMAPVERGRSSRKRGPSFLAILLIASALSAMVVGGLYLAHEASLLEDHHDDPPKISFPEKKKKKKSNNTTAQQPDPPDPLPDPVPDPTPEPQTQPPSPQPPKPGPGPQPPKPQPSTQPPKPQPPPLVIPSKLPPLPSVIPIPGLPGGPFQPKTNPAPAPAPKPAPRPAPAPQPTKRPPLKPLPRTQPAPTPAPRPAPAPAPKKRRKFPRLQPVNPK